MKRFGPESTNNTPKYTFALIFSLKNASKAHKISISYNIYGKNDLFKFKSDNVHHSVPGFHSWFDFHHFVRDVNNANSDFSRLWVALTL